MRSIKLFAVACVLAVLLAWASAHCSSTATADSALPVHPPTYLRITESRYVWLQRTMEGFRQSGQPMVASSSLGWEAAENSDDPGLYYIVPAVARRFGLSLEHSVDLLLTLIVVLATFVGLSGFYYRYKSSPSRLISTVALIGIGCGSLIRGDIYVLQAAVPIALVPWIMQFVRGRTLRPHWVPFLLATGLVAGCSHVIRSHSGTAILLLSISLLVFWFRGSRTRRALAVLVLMVGTMVPVIYMTRVLAQRDRFLLSVRPDYYALTGTHPFWHSVYIGFAFIKNDVVPQYADLVASNAVQGIAPGTRYVSLEYERILRRQVWIIAKTRPWFVFETLIAKAAVCAVAIALFANFGLLAAFFYPKQWEIELSFWTAIIFDAMFAILVMPKVAYMLGLMAMSTLYAVLSINEAVNRGAWARVINTVRARRHTQAGGLMC
jgi:hypothetical protein